MKSKPFSKELIDKELDILRHAVDEAQRKKGKLIRTPQIKNIINIKLIRK